ncbi:DUF6011 domain-containing protein [Candidatus Dojkabacteria bacterium]|jgi:hypothetical protein|nr:DUF6011 domain-containing protein [Candidatus Dojkabacteria bacterium]
MGTITRNKMEVQLKTDYIRKFIIGGKANFTVKSLKTYDHLIFRISKSKERDVKYFVSVDTHYGKFMCIGLLYLSKDGTNFTFVKSSKMADNDAKSIKVIKYLVDNYLNKNNPTSMLEFYHHGTCARCGRKLTTPQSIEIGIGPECLKRS